MLLVRKRLDYVEIIRDRVAVLHLRKVRDHDSAHDSFSNRGPWKISTLLCSPAFTMLGAAVVVFLSLLPRYVAQLLTTEAQCLSGYNWVSIPTQILRMSIDFHLQLYSSIGQSPCDIAAELAGACVGGRASCSSL